MAPPYIGTTIQVRIPDEYVAAIDEQVAVDNTSRAEVVRGLVIEAMTNRARRARRREGKA